MTNGCGDTLISNVLVDSATLYLRANVSCEGGLVSAYSNVPNVTFIFKDSVGQVLETNTTGLFSPTYQGIIKIGARTEGCGANEISLNIFANPTLTLTYASCDSVAVVPCPRIAGWDFILRGATGNIIARNKTGNFGGINNGTTYDVLAVHPKFRDTVRVSVGTYTLPELSTHYITCSSFCAYFPYGWVDQHNAPTTCILTDSITNRVLKTQIDDGCFYNLQPNTTYIFTAVHPYCGTRKIIVKTAPADRAKYCLEPAGRKNRQGKPEFGWILRGTAATTNFTLQGGLDTINVRAANGVFTELAPGTYILKTDCAADTIILPPVKNNILAKSGPSCPNVASIQAYGGRTAANWSALKDSLHVEICNANDDYYDFYDKNGGYIGSTPNGFMNYLIPGERYEIRLSRYGFQFDTVFQTATFYERPDLVTKYGVICAVGRTEGRIAANLTGGSAPYTFEILQPAGIRPSVRSNTGQASFENLPAGSYTLRAYDVCGISADYTGSIGFLKFTPKYQRLCDGWIQLEVPEIDSAKYEWKNANGTTVGRNNILTIKDTTSITYTVVVKTVDSCNFTNNITVPRLLSNAVKANAGEDIVENSPNIRLNAVPVSNNQKGRWRQITPSSGGTVFSDPTNPKTDIRVTQFPGQYTYLWEVTDDSLGCVSYDTLTVVFCQTISTLDAQLVATVSSCLKPTGTAKVTVSNATTPLSYKWSNGKTTPQIDSLVGGRYAVTVNDELACTPPLVKEFDIVQPIVKATANKSDATCFGKANGTVLLNPSGGSGRYTINWSDNNTALSRPNLLSGHYTFTVTDSDGCFFTDSLSISQPNLITSSRHDTLCWGDSLRIGRSIHKTTGSYQDTLLAFTGCDSLVYSTLHIRPLPYTNQKLRICYGDSVLVGSKKYKATGTYLDTLRAIYGCDSLVATNLEVLKMDALFVSTPAICTPNGTLEVKARSTFNDHPFVYRWNTGQQTAKINYLAFGKYAVTVSQSGCSVVFEGQVDSLPNLLSLSSTIQNPNCPKENSGSIKLTVKDSKSPLRIKWNTGDTSIVLKNLLQGKYDVAIIDDNGCPLKDTFLLIAPNEFDMTLSTKDITCFGYKDGSIEMKLAKGGSPVYLFALDKSENYKDSIIFKGLEVGTHTIKLKDSHGCFFKKDIVVNEPERLKVTIEGENIVNLGDSIRLLASINSPFHAPMTFKWNSTAKLTCDNCFDLFAKAYQNFSVFLFAKDANSCFTTDSINIHIDKTRKTFVPNVFSPNGDGTNDYFNIYSNAGLKNIKQLKIYNRWGSLVYETTNLLPNNPQMGWDGTYRGQSLNPDVFVFWAEIEWFDGLTSMLQGDVTLVK